MAFFVCPKTNLNKTAKKRFHKQWVSFIPPKKCNQKSSNATIKNLQTAQQKIFKRHNKKSSNGTIKNLQMA